MDIIALLKSGADIGLTAPALMAIGILWQINNKFHGFDKRLTVVEAKVK